MPSNATFPIVLPLAIALVVATQILYQWWVVVLSCWWIHFLENHHRQQQQLVVVDSPTAVSITAVAAVRPATVVSAEEAVLAVAEPSSLSMGTANYLGVVAQEVVTLAAVAPRWHRRRR